jgi:stage II sporulation protein D
LHARDGVRRRGRAILFATGLVISAVATSGTASAATLHALPAAVRVNVAGLGVLVAEIGSTGSFTATAPDGKQLYRGNAKVAVRRNVYRLRDGPPLPDRRVPPADAAERASRLQLIREAKVAQSESGDRAILLVPFEVSVPTDRDPIGDTALRADRILGVRFVADDGLLTFNGRAYRGTLEIVADDEGDMIVVNTVPTFDYLAGVVGGEMPSSWHPEALAAQAIAARTYVLTHMQKHDRYDIEGDTRDQNYEGLGSTTAATIRAVERTRGLVATYRGAAIEALYSANAGGVTEDSENVFGNALPYLRGVPSPFDREAESSSWGHTSWSWTKEWNAPALGAYMRQRSFDVGEPQRIELVRTSGSGRVLQARVVGSRDTKDIGKDRTRYYFGLMSSLFTVERRGGGEIETATYLQADRVRELETLGAKVLGIGYRVSAESGSEIPTYTAISSTYELPARFVFSGKGFGHGVGMSQWGMQGMALAGASAEDILRHYYTGIDLTQVGGP